ncbi:MAG TPA: PEP-utilizing enzyme [Candidatus Saccharimonadales bacterium]|nr:PEP-utilizing enzyme [Candidatus Saccharimonadales bacterium]
MADGNLADIWKTQKSLTEWLEDIKHKDAEAIRREDNDKRERLKVLNKIIGLPFDEPVQFDGDDLSNRSPELIKYIKEHGEELCALRLMPKEDGLPKLRMRGKSVSEAYDWFLEQKVDGSKYRADFVPHVDKTRWATIFVVNKHGIQGEITSGGHHELTQGFHGSAKPHVFKYDFKKWSIQPEDKEALEHLKTLANYLHVADKAQQDQIKKELGGTFSNDYLEGYFESTNSGEFGTWFIDYSQSLGKMYEDFLINTKSSSGSLVRGRTGCGGQAKGRVAIVNNPSDDFLAGSILVCEVTTPDFVPLMQKAAAIVTDQGGILSHAAIVARELKVPCIVGTGNATKKLKNGQTVSVDADLGVVC